MKTKRQMPKSVFHLVALLIVGSYTAAIGCTGHRTGNGDVYPDGGLEDAIDSVFAPGEVGLAVHNATEQSTIGDILLIRF